ncbi:MAG: hypothetical protein NTU60_11575 [Candidatus Aminicenantes bacterium]|nr:hypothetical protein [Candidatus Aminicenantes bacterium]
MKSKAEQSCQEKLRALEPCQEAVYRNIDLNSLATFAINWLQQRNIPTTFENIVVFLYKMFPSKFALEGYSDFPDSARVGRSLLQLGPKYRNWARGSVQQGFLLTDAGLSKADRVSQIISSGKPQIQEDIKKSQAIKRTMDPSKELASLEQSSLFTKWKEGTLDEENTMDFLIMLGAYAYTPLRAIRDRAKLLQETALQAGRSDICSFLKNVIKVLEHRMGESA